MASPFAQHQVDFGEGRLLSPGQIGTIVPPAHNSPIPSPDPSSNHSNYHRTPSTLHPSIATTPRQNQSLASPQTVIESSEVPKHRDIQESTASYIPTPPNTNHRGQRKLAPKLSMNDEQNFVQPDFLSTSQVQDMGALLDVTAESFGYPMSAPVTAPPTFWDNNLNMIMDMDMDFGDASAVDMFQQPMTPSHRPSGSFDWNNEVPLFEAPQVPQIPQASQPAQPVPPPTTTENVRPAPPQRRERVLAPKPPATDNQTTSAAPSSLIASSYHPNLGDPFGISNAETEPGKPFSRPQSAAADSSFRMNTDAAGSTGQPIASETGNESTGPGIRRSASSRSMKSGKMPDRASASSPIKPSMPRPGLGRSFSENRGRKSAIRNQMATQGPGSRPNAQARNGASKENSQNMARPSGRTSPLKSQQHVSSLAAIPESATRPRPRSNIQFCIVGGRAEARLVPESPEPQPHLGSHIMGESGEIQYVVSDDESSDDEEILIPSRNVSFALPDPRKPVGSIYANDDDTESDAETIMNDGQEQQGSAHGDAVSELRKVLQNRQRQAMHVSNAQPLGFHTVGSGGLHHGNLANLPVGGRDVRCVCSRGSAEKDAGYLIQWYVQNVGPTQNLIGGS